VTVIHLTDTVAERLGQYAVMVMPVLALWGNHVGQSRGIARGLESHLYWIRQLAPFASAPGSVSSDEQCEQ
jgi:hypothetical protein